MRKITKVFIREEGNPFYIDINEDMEAYWFAARTDKGELPQGIPVLLIRFQKENKEIMYPMHMIDHLEFNG